MKYEIEMTEQDLKDLRAVRNYFGENDRTIFEHKAYAILDRLVKKLNTPRVSNSFCPECGDNSGWYADEDLIYNCSKCNPQAK